MSTKGRSYIKSLATLSRRQSQILKLLKQEDDGLTRRQLAKRLKTESNGVTSAVKSLLESGLVITDGEVWDAETKRHQSVLHLAPRGYVKPNQELQELGKRPAVETVFDFYEQQIRDLRQKLEVAITTINYLQKTSAAVDKLATEVANVAKR